MNVSLTIASKGVGGETRILAYDGTEEHHATYRTPALAVQRLGEIVGALVSELAQGITTGDIIGAEIHLISEPDVVALATMLLV